MAPTGTAYNVDWVFSNSSDVHLANHRDWFVTFTPFETKVCNGFGAITLANAKTKVMGIGDVELPVKVKST